MIETIYLILAVQVSIATFILVYKGANVKDDV